MQAGHHSVMAGVLPYDYRVAYFERASTSSPGYFSLPWVWDLNPAIPKTSASTPVHDELNSVDFAYSISVGWSPSTTSLSGDYQMAGNIEWYGLYNLRCWRIAGVCSWGSASPTQSQIPLIRGNVVRVVYAPHGCDIDDSEGHIFSQDYQHGSIFLHSDRKFLIFANSRDWATTPDHNGQAGFRFFHASVMNAHPTYGFRANYICVVKDGEPYVYDTINDRFFSKQRNSVVVGPQVPPNWDHMTWTEPS